MIYNPAINPQTTSTHTPNQISDFRIESISPNPSFGPLNIALEVEKPQAVLITLSNILGKKMKQEEVQLQRGDFQHSMDISTFPAGTYFLSIHKGKAVTTSKIIKK